MSATLVALVATEAREAAKDCTTLDERIRAAMKSAANHWMVLDRDQQFQGAVTAIYELSDEATRERLTRELDVLKALSAVVQGVPVDFGALVGVEGEAPEPIGLSKFWREAIA